MKLQKFKLFFLYFTLILLGFNYLFSQSALIPEVKLKDHNNNTKIININCDYNFLPGKKIQLITEFPEIKQPNTYNVESVPYKPIGDFKDGNLVTIKRDNGKQDDTFSNIISLPFDFCFYGNKYNSIIISDNGVVSFNTKLAKDECPYAPVNTLISGLPKNSIFGVFHDMLNINEVRYRVEGTYPNRKVIINYNNIPQYGYPMPNKNSTSQIILYETTNIIDVYIKDRYKNESTNPIFNEDNAYRKNAIVGLTNYDSSNGIIAPGRNSGNWEAHNEGWRFTPNGNTDITIVWKYNGFEISGTRNKKTIIVQPAEDGKYSVEVTYNLCSPFKIKEDIDVKFSNNFPKVKEITTQAFCLDSGKNYTIDLTGYQSEINPDQSLIFTYFENLDTNSIPINPINNPKNYVYSNDKTIYVKVLKKGVCYTIGKINLKLNKKPVVPENQYFEECDPDNGGKKIIKIKNYNFKGLSGTYHKVFTSLSDAQNGIGEINENSFNLDVNGEPDATKTFYLRVWNSNYNDPSCFTIVPFKIKLKKTIRLNIPKEEFEICDVIEGQTIKYDLTQHESQLINFPTNGLTFEYFTDPSYSYWYKISDPKSATITLSATIYVKATSKDYCEGYSQIKFKPVKCSDDIDDGGAGGGGGGGLNLCNADKTSYTVKLDKNYLRYYLPPGLILDKIDIVGFYDLKTNELITKTPPYTYVVSVPSARNIKAVYKIKSNGVETSVKFPVFASAKSEIDPDVFFICDTYIDGLGKEKVSFYNKYKNIINSYYSNRATNILFFKSKQDLLDYKLDNTLENYINETEVVQFEKKTIYVYLKFFGCIYEHEIHFILSPINQKIIGPYEVCDFDNNNKEIINILNKTNYEEDLKALLSPAQLAKLKTPIRYYNTIESASVNYPYQYITNIENFEVNTSPMSVWARLEIQDECPIFVEIKFEFSKTSISLPEYNAELFPCANKNDKNRKIDLNQFIISKDSNSVISFYSTEKGALNGDNGTLLGGRVYDGNPLIYNSVNNEHIIYMRVYDKKTQCVKVIPLKITFIFPLDIINQTINICDSENDKKETVTTQFIQDQFISVNPGLTGPPTTTYKFFATEEEATNNTTASLTTFTVTPTNFIWVRILKNTGDCPIITKIEFDLKESPKLNSSPLSFFICNNNTGNENGETKEIVNLDDYRTKILDLSYNISGYNFSYYDTEEDAKNDIDAKSSAYIINSFPKTIWARVKDKNFGCFSIKSFTIDALNPFKDKGEIKDGEIISCVAGEMSKEINLEEYPPKMIDNNKSNAKDFKITYYTSRKNAVDGINEIPDTEINNYIITPASQIWVKFILRSDSINKCYIIKKLNVTLYSSPKAQDIFPEICDESDGHIDGKFVIPDLDEYRERIIPGETLTTINSLYPFTYYSTITGAKNQDPNDLLNKTNFTFSENNLTHGNGSDPNFYIIYARIDKNDNTGCYSIVGISFLVNKKVPIDKKDPINKTGINLDKCDENTEPGYDDGKSLFNLKSVEDIWAKYLPDNNTKFKYFKTEDDAQNNKNPIDEQELTNYENTVKYNDKVYVRISADRYCDSIAVINLNVYPSIRTKDYDIGNICQFENGTGNDTRIDLTSKISSMQTNLYPNQLNDLHVTFYTNLTDAETGVAPLGDLDTPTAAITNYLPVLGNTTIYVRFESRTKGCFRINKITMNKLKAPEPRPFTMPICDDDLDDIFYIIPDQLDHIGFIDTPTNYNLSYFLTKEDAWKNNAELPKNQKYIINSFDTNIFVRVVDKITGCINVNTIIITTNPKISLINKEVELEACDGDNDGYTSFDLSLVNADIVNSLSETNVKFSYFSSLEDAQKQQNEQTNFSSYQNLNPKVDYVYVRLDELNPIGKKCPSLAKIKLKTYYPDNPLPKFIYLCPRIDSLKLNGGNFDEWEWSLNGKVISTDRYFTVKDIGVYSLKVTKYLNYNLTCSVVFKVEAKHLEDPVILELKAGDNYITVIAKGPQPLEYSIDNINWQTSNTFTNLEPGIYTFYVRSKANGCEAITSKGIIFKVPNAITPNGDGYNDTWKLCGLNLFNSPSQIKIFDRYGKKVFEQQSDNCFLWDGKYLGRNLPTTSYWYIITIADGRKFTGWILLRNYDESYR
ncbi:T9SS type B sorting domain-containing protein [Apibacter adventoris]|uniref:Ig-like domain-containing protein n=1 Tax=Apibacter adventoris TaxID=1679466 RepID=A0A2S8A746_9FLAO|nr:T9SS type B sorting domain-containing protein [Apibacter adventoris]PQL90391.1 hypothetical protein C4S77_10875 [Apibacter adventoris]